MKFALVFLVHCLIAAGLAKPAVFLGYQDSLGQYSFGYSAPGSARSEVRTSNGATRGTYSYVDESGVIQTAQYVADGENGFRVFATNLPQAPLPVQDTPEVMAARTAHLQALELATRRDEEAQERKLEGDQGDANLGKTQEQFVEAKLVKLPLKEKNESSEKVESKKDNDESLQAVASRSGVEKTSENTTQDIREASGGNAVPIFRISYGIHEIEPPAQPKSSIVQVQGTSGATTPAATILKSTAISAKHQAATPEEQQQQQQQQQQQLWQNLFVCNPLSTPHTSFIRYPSPVSHYTAYNVL